MRFLNDWWGINENIAPAEIMLRAVVMFIITVLMLRIYGMRPFGKESTFDTIITFFIGGILVRGIVGATPFFSTVAAAIAILLIHKIMSKLSFYNKAFGWLVKGKPLLLYKDGNFHIENMKKNDITEHDICEEMRIVSQANSFDKIKEIYLERTGEISFVKKEQE